MAPRSAQTPVVLNVYDLSPANDYVSALGVGLFHSGIEIAGDEYSFASGAGIFTTTPRQAAGAVFRESITLGVFSGSHTEARQLAFSLRPEFAGDSYNLLTKNCNTYAEALSQLLLGKSIPAYVNRLAYFGSFLSCLLPADAGSQAPVGDTTARLTNGHPRRSDFIYSPFAGAGQTVGGVAASSKSGTDSKGPSSEASALEDRREKLRQAALRRFESHQNAE
ncbi:hypothetical protein PybrP1_008165 [[Pythium] brassicae (nom. inval.)]|nr:hypothetical protein PybrP1_008165 [[Pythium] brassicae (nom. inval.)]